MKANANSLILSAVIIAATSTLVRQQLNHEPLKYARTILGAFGLGFGLSLTATASPDVADGIAWLVIITSVLVNGQPIFDRINQETSKTSKTSKTGHTQTATHLTPHYVQA